MIKIILSSVFVDDQDKALRFYTDVLGFVKRQDVPASPDRFLTVTAPGGPEGVELLLEPNGNPAAKAYQEAVYQQGIPATTFGTDDIHKEYERLKAQGVAFTMKPTALGPVTSAVFDDTCGNLIMIAQVGS